MSNEKENANAPVQDEWESAKGSGETWNPKQDADKIQYAPAERVYDAKAQPSHAEKDILIGYWIDKRDNIGQYNSSVATIVRKEDGKKVDVWLDTVLEKEFEKIPAMNILVRIEWLGQKLKKDKKEGQKGAVFNAWDVKFKQNDTYGEVKSAPIKKDEEPTITTQQSEGPGNNLANKPKSVVADDKKPAQTKVSESPFSGDNDDLPF